MLLFCFFSLLSCAYPCDFSISSRALARLRSVTLSPEIMRANTCTRPSRSSGWISVKVRLSRTFFSISSWLSAKAAICDPFQHLDQIGVGKLVKMAAHDGRATNPNLGLGICGEHGGDPSSVEFCHNVGLDYVSCSPYRVPIARLAAAQAAIKNPRS